MTLQQLRYVTAVADARTISKAAQKFYISQPSLTNSIHELEQELGLTIFHRTNRGVVLTPEGDVFLGYARQVLAQVGLIEEKYLALPRSGISSAFLPSTIPLPWKLLYSC